MDFLQVVTVTGANILSCRNSWIFCFYDSLGSQMFLWRKSWIFCCYDLWEVNVSLQIIVDFLILWLFCKSNVFLKEIEDFPLLLLVRSQCISADNCGFSAFMTLWKVKCFSGDFLMLWLVRRQYLSADNCGFSAFVTLLEVKKFLCRKLWIFCC